MPIGNGRDDGRVRTGMLLGVCVLLAGLVVGGGDTAAILFAHVAVHSDAAGIGVAATRAVYGEPATPQTAQRAFQAAQADAASHGDRVLPDSTFTVLPDGSVRMTVERVAPTLFLSWAGWGRRLAVARYTFTAPPLDY